MTIFNVLLLFLALVLAFYVYVFVYLPHTSSLRDLPGPPPPAGIIGFQGHLPWVLNQKAARTVHEANVKKYGKSFRIKGAGHWEDRLLTTDPAAIAHVLNHPLDYEKPWQSRRFITRLIGEGMLAAEGQVHKRMRRVGHPAFSVQNMRALVPIVFSKAVELKDKWMEMAKETPVGIRIVGQDKLVTGTIVDVCHWISRATFDVIGLMGFDYNFSAIQNESNELFLAYKEMFEVAVSQGGGGGFRTFLTIMFYPWFERLFPDESTRIIKKSQEIIYRIGRSIVQDKKQQFLSNEKGGRDFITLLIKSNLSTEIPVEQRISDDDILNNLNTFFFAGSDTSSLALTWSCYLLAEHRDIQTRLRAELETVSFPDAQLPPDSPEWHAFWTQLDDLHGLDNVVKETLRLIPPVHSSIRMSTKEDEIPTSEPVRMRDGSLKYGIKIKKGCFIHIPVESMNLDKGVWGEDSWRFKPDRWDDLPDAVRGQPGLYSNLLTFSSGPRSCIGMRFSIIEMKAFLYVLLLNFEFNLLDGTTIFPYNAVLTRPYVSGKFRLGSQCPMSIIPLNPQ